MYALVINVLQVHSVLSFDEDLEACFRRFEDDAVVDALDNSNGLQSQDVSARDVLPPLSDSFVRGIHPDEVLGCNGMKAAAHVLGNGRAVAREFQQQGAKVNALDLDQVCVWCILCFLANRTHIVIGVASVSIIWIFVYVRYFYSPYVSPPSLASFTVLPLLYVCGMP